MITLTVAVVTLIISVSLAVLVFHIKENRTWCFASTQKMLDSYGLTSDVLSQLGMNNCRFRSMDIRVRQFSQEPRIGFNGVCVPTLTRSLSISRFKKVSRNVMTHSVTDSTFKNHGWVRL